MLEYTIRCLVEEWQILKTLFARRKIGEGNKEILVGKGFGWPARSIVEAADIRMNPSQTVFPRFRASEQETTHNNESCENNKSKQTNWVNEKNTSAYSTASSVKRLAKKLQTTPAAAEVQLEHKSGFRLPAEIRQALIRL
ncbi:hypothetical protein RRG08_045932 [Elysia crispata]|uniref:Uncharacterized protein n=1 Tax=Elysia crispata TaxID=231223 RepID=A0AAE1E4C0_9GAST|nr:hypothetical protein RRG08_045932 [Elysia crispata]